METRDYAQEVFNRNCKNCPSRELCSQLGQFCQTYQNDLELAKKQRGSIYEKND